MKQKKINLERMIQDALYDYDKTVVVDKDKLNVIINIMREFSKQLLELAAENAKCDLKSKILCDLNELQYGCVVGDNLVVTINKQSILDTIKQIK